MPVLVTSVVLLKQVNVMAIVSGTNRTIYASTFETIETGWTFYVERQPKYPGVHIGKINDHNFVL